VFKISQTEGIPIPEPKETVNQFTHIQKAEEIISTMPFRPEIKFGGNRAYYSAANDIVQIPNTTANIYLLRHKQRGIFEYLDFSDLLKLWGFRPLMTNICQTFLSMRLIRDMIPCCVVSDEFQCMRRCQGFVR
jgi:hypothetical protein